MKIVSDDQSLVLSGSMISLKAGCAPRKQPLKTNDLSHGPVSWDQSLNPSKNLPGPQRFQRAASWAF